MREGQRNLHSDDKVARERFDEALALIDSADSSTHNIEQLRRDALSGKYRAIVNDYETDTEADSAIQYLTHFVEDDLSNLDSDSDLVNQVEALRHDLICKENIRNSAVDLARENLRESLELYSKADLNKSKARVYARLQLMEGYLDELKANFSSAAERYETASTIHSESLDNNELANRYADISHICKSKSCILKKDLEGCFHHLDQISGGSSTVSTHRDAVFQIGSLLDEYLDDDISEGITPGSSIPVTRINGIVEADFNLDEAQFVIYASQYLRQYGFSLEILNTIIDISLKDSLTPNPQQTEFDYDSPTKSENQKLLMSISMDEVWQSKLPSHIHYQIEKLKINEVTQAGDFSGLTNELTKTLELLLVVISEYYSRLAYGEIDKSISPLKRTALGDLLEFITDLPPEILPVVNELKQTFSEEFLPNREISEIRNTGHHGADIRHSKQQYEQILEKIVDIFRKLSTYCPVIIEVEDQNVLDMYLCVVHWGGIKTRVWLQTDADLELNELYYLSPDDVGEKHLVTVSADDIYPCESPRARNVRKINPVTLEDETQN